MAVSSQQDANKAEHIAHQAQIRSKDNVINDLRARVETGDSEMMHGIALRDQELRATKQQLDSITVSEGGNWLLSRLNAMMQ